MLDTPDVGHFPEETVCCTITNLLETKQSVQQMQKNRDHNQWKTYWSHRLMVGKEKLHSISRSLRTRC